MSERRAVSMIVAAAENGVIGRNGELPWKLPADLARFKRLTMGDTLVMGRKTYESIGRPLPGRQSIVLTRQAGWSPGHEAVRVVGSLDAALEAAGRDTQVFVIGGGEVYRLALPAASRVHLTRVHAEVEGDATFPALNETDWLRTEAEEHAADARNELPFTFETWERLEPTDPPQTA